MDEKAVDKEKDFEAKDNGNGQDIHRAYESWFMDRQSIFARWDLLPVLAKIFFANLKNELIYIVNTIRIKSNS